ncbi:unnamed protein product [Choristocarpus tenellus]
MIAVPVKEPLLSGKTKIGMILIKPDPKVNPPEVTLTLEGVSSKVNGRQVEMIVTLLTRLSTHDCSSPDKSIFNTRDGRG